MDVLIYIAFAGFFIYLGFILALFICDGEDRGRRLLQATSGVVIVALGFAVQHGLRLSEYPDFWISLSSELTFLRATAFLALGLNVGVGCYLLWNEPRPTPPQPWWKFWG